MPSNAMDYLESAKVFFWMAANIIEKKFRLKQIFQTGWNQYLGFADLIHISQAQYAIYYNIESVTTAEKFVL